MRHKKFDTNIKLKLISLSGKCFWYWNGFYSFFASCLNIPATELKKRFPKELGNKYKITEDILDFVENKHDANSIKNILSAFYKLEKPFDKDENPNYRKALEELNEFKKIVGKDVIQEEIEQENFRKKIQTEKNRSFLEKIKEQKIDELFRIFSDYAMKNDKNQKRGYWLEKAFYDIMDLESIENVRPYKTKNEQIDGYIKFEFDYLVEIKWQTDEIKQEDISIFEGKIDSKGQSTRGIFVSISNFSQSAIDKAQNKNSPKIIFIDVQDLISVFTKVKTFSDIFQTSIDRLVRHGKVYK